MKLVIPLYSLYLSIHTKDESKGRTAFAFIFGVNWLWCSGFTAFKIHFFAEALQPKSSARLHVSARLLLGKEQVDRIPEAWGMYLMFMNHRKKSAWNVLEPLSTGTSSYGTFSGSIVHPFTLKTTGIYMYSLTFILCAKVLFAALTFQYLPLSYCKSA